LTMLESLLVIGVFAIGCGLWLDIIVTRLRLRREAEAQARRRRKRMVREGSA